MNDVRNQGPGDVPLPGVYLPTTTTVFGNTARQILVRTTGDAGAVLPALERAIRAVDPNVPVRPGTTLEDDLRRIFLAQPRFSLVILTVFAGVGLTLVAVGVYGVMAYAVSRRAQEFAIRMALGATRHDVVRAVLRSGTALLGIGIIAGLGMSSMTNRLVINSVIGPSVPDVRLSGIVAVAVITAVGLAACLIPALRASRTSPMAALRQD